MLICQKTPGCSLLDGRGTPCEKRVVKITPELVTISYRKDGKNYLLSMPSDHAEWAEEMLNLDREAVERAAAEKAVREMAEYLTVKTVDPAYEGQGNDGEFGSGFYQGVRSCRRALRARAEAYRQERGE